MQRKPLRRIGYETVTVVTRPVVGVSAWEKIARGTVRARMV